MSAISYQVNMNNFLSLLVGASLVAANSSPSHHDLTSFSAPTEFSNGVSSFALPAEDRMAYDSYTLAYLNYSYVNAEGTENRDVELVGKYGEGHIFNRTGTLVHVTGVKDREDHYGCNWPWNGTGGGPLPAANESWIALIKRGNCNFEEKVKHAYKQGAVAVIIYNDKDDQRLDKMKINDKERNITAVFTTKAKGQELSDLLALNYNVTMSIIEGSKHYRSLTSINRTSVLFVSISFIVLMIISLVWLVFYYVQRFRYLQTKDKQSRRLCNVAKRIIAKIPTKSIKSDDKEIDNDCCAICIEPYKVTDVIRVLPCKHEFHKACIDPWLLEHRTCPMCKMDILKHYGFVFTGSQESILQLDLDMEEGDLIDDHSSTDGGGYQRRHSVSPLPQIRASSENPRSRSSSESDSDHDRQQQQHRMGSASNPHSNRQSLIREGLGAVCVNVANAGVNDSEETTGDGLRADGVNDICVSCLAAALNKKHQIGGNSCSQEDDLDDSDSFTMERHGSLSLPATLKKYKGNHSTGSCRGMNPREDHHHNQQQQQQQQQQSNLPFRFYKTDHSHTRKIRTPLKNLLSQSQSAPCDDGSLTDIHLGTEERTCSDAPAAIVAALQERRCSLSRTSSSGSDTNRNLAHYQQHHHHHQTHQHHSQHHLHGAETETDGSDETEPNSDNDLIVKVKGESGDGECKKK